MKKILIFLVLCSFSSRIFSMDPDATTAAKFQAEPMFTTLKNKAATLKADTSNTAVRDIRRWFASWAELVNKNPAYRALTTKKGGIDKLFGASFATTVGDAALQQKGNVSLGALLAAYDTWGVKKGGPVTPPAEEPKTLTEAITQATAAAKAVYDAIAALPTTDARKAEATTGVGKISDALTKAPTV